MCNDRNGYLKGWRFCCPNGLVFRFVSFLTRKGCFVETVRLGPGFVVGLDRWLRLAGFLFSRRLVTDEGWDRGLVRWGSWFCFGFVGVVFVLKGILFFAICSVGLLGSVIFFVLAFGSLVGLPLRRYLVLSFM